MLTVIFAWEIPLTAFAETVDTEPMEADFSAVTLAFALVTFSWLTLPGNCTLQAALTLRLSTFRNLFQRNGCGCRQAFAQLQGLQLTADGQRGLGAEGEASAFAGAILDRDTDAALFAFSKLMVAFCSETERTTLYSYKLHHIVDDLQVSTAGRRLHWEESASANRLSCKEQRGEEYRKKFFHTHWFLSDVGWWLVGWDCTFCLPNKSVC